MGNRSDYSGNEARRRASAHEEKEGNHIGEEDTVYRYLCPLRKIGSVIGIGGDIAKKLRAETQARIRINETIPGCDERVITIYSTSLETNTYRDEAVSPAQDALFKVHERVVAEELPVNGAFEEPFQVTVRLLVPSDQIGCVIGKGGQIVQNIRNETHAQIRILGNERLPPCALSSDELVQITGESTVVENALYQVASCLHDNPSRSQQSLLASPSIYRSGFAFNPPNASSPLAGSASLMGPYGSYKNEDSEHSSVMKEFTIRLVCPTENLGAVIGKGGAIIKQIRQESGAFIVVDSSGAEGGDCVVSISFKEMFEAPSRAMDATLRLQQRCSEKIEKDSGDTVMTTRVLVPSSRIGCIIGKGGAIIKEMRNTTRARIRVLSDENVPKVASEDEEMVQITGDLNSARNALLQVMQRLKVNLFEFEGSSKYANRENRSNKPVVLLYSDGYNSEPSPAVNSYGNHDDSQVVAGSLYGTYTSYSAGQSSGASYGA